MREVGPFLKSAHILILLQLTSILDMPKSNLLSEKSEYV